MDVFLTVRASSRRLPNKCFKPFGNSSVIEYVIERALFFNFNPIICTTCNRHDDKIIEIAQNMGVRFFRGSEKNKLLRWSECAKAFDIEFFHTIDCDDLYFDKSQIIRSFGHLVQNELDCVLPSLASENGLGTEGYSFKSSFLATLVKDMDSNIDTEMVLPFITAFAETSINPIESLVDEIPEIRLTLDYAEDYEFLKRIKSSLGDHPTTFEIINLITEQPELTKINWFRNDSWKSNQKDKIFNTKRTMKCP